ncbi:hypothetical protein llg_24920 [Luteolibacter sp. LG18]|nr:hypothetical protein llg_24920 [Luteolibacter sp. LG18]
MVSPACAADWQQLALNGGVVSVYAQEIALVPGSAYLMPMGGDLYFWKTGAAGGFALCRVTSAGVVSVLKGDVAEERFSEPGALCVMNGKLYFPARVPDGPIGLWCSDVTSAGTVLVKDDFYVDRELYSLRALTAVGSVLYFNPQDTGYGGDLWKSDGTPQGTVLVKTDVSGGEGGGPESFAAAAGTTFFQAWDWQNGAELWKTDGTASGTQRVKDIASGSNWGSPGLFTPLGGLVYFRAADGNGFDLWKSNGTTAGTTRVHAFGSGWLAGLSEATRIVVSGGKLFFPASGELWVSDGTDGGTVAVETGDEFPVSVPAPRSLTASGGLVYFISNDGGHGEELWCTNGTAAGTRMLKDIRPGGATSLPGNLTDVNGVLYFTADDGVHGLELWRSDGTETGTVLAADVVPGAAGSGVANLTAVGTKLYFSRYQTYLIAPLCVMETAVGSGFDAWAAAAGLTGGDAAAGAVPRGDGVKNLLKYAFNLDPSVADCRTLVPGTGTAGLPCVTRSGSGAGAVLRIEYLRRKNSGLTYRAVQSATLLPGSFSVFSGTPVVTAVGSAWERVVVETPCDPAVTPRLFGRVEVALEP